MLPAIKTSNGSTVKIVGNKMISTYYQFWEHTQLQKNQTTLCLNDTDVWSMTLKNYHLLS